MVKDLMVPFFRYATVTKTPAYAAVLALEGGAKENPPDRYKHWRFVSDKGDAWWATSQLDVLKGRGWIQENGRFQGISYTGFSTNSSNPWSTSTTCGKSPWRTSAGEALTSR
jgi:hypothetical protein